MTVSFEAFAKLVRCCGDRYGMNLLADKALESTVALRGAGSGKIGIDLGVCSFGMLHVRHAPSVFTALL